MDNFMALEILKILKSGESNGYHTIKRDILDMESFLDKTETDFQTTFRKLQELNHILPYSNETTNNLQAFRLNNEKDFIALYERKLEETLNNKTQSNRINELTLEALQREKDNSALRKQLDEVTLKLSVAQNADIPINASDRKTALTWAIIAAIIGWLGFLYQLLKN